MRLYRPELPALCAPLRALAKQHWVLVRDQQIRATYSLARTGRLSSHSVGTAAWSEVSWTVPAWHRVKTRVCIAAAGGPACAQQHR